MPLQDNSAELSFGSGTPVQPDTWGWDKGVGGCQDGDKVLASSLYD